MAAYGSSYASDVLSLRQFKHIFFILLLVARCVCIFIFNITLVNYSWPILDASVCNNYNQYIKVMWKIPRNY